jgi:hypothetical protein
MSHHSVAIRATTASDHDRLASLTTRSCSPLGRGLSLVAEAEGTVLAAISLTTGSVAVDPNWAHPELIHSLRYRRYQILRQGGEVGLARTLLRRLAPPPGVISRSLPHDGATRSPSGPSDRGWSSSS